MLPTHLFFLSAVIASFALYVALAWSPKIFLLDQPNARSLHDVPKPRYGGIAMAIAVVVVVPFLDLQSVRTILWLSLVLLVISLLDDLRPLPVVLRLCAHAAAATIAVVFVTTPAAATQPLQELFQHSLATTSALGIVILFVIWMTNLFNFMDGADGLAGGMTIIGFGTYALAAADTGDTGYAIATIATAIAGAAAGFLFFNFPPAKVFMGDAGSVPLGFLAATLGICGHRSGLWPWSFCLLLFSPFIVDASITLVKRALRGEKIWQAHREHYYQRLILGGWSHRKTVFSYYILMLSSAISALATQNTQLQYPILGFWVITYASLLLYLEHRIFKNKKATQKAIDQAK